MADFKWWLDTLSGAGKWFLLGVAMLAALVAWAERRAQARKKRLDAEADIDPKQNAQRQADDDVGGV